MLYIILTTIMVTFSLFLPLMVFFYKTSSARGDQVYYLNGIRIIVSIIGACFLINYYMGEYSTILPAWDYDLSWYSL